MVNIERDRKYKVIGVMSGTSLDGLDLALCNFIFNGATWSFEILKSKTVPYTSVWQERLSGAQNLSAYDFVRLHRQYGDFIGEQIAFFAQGETDIDFVASHGHTVFHEPDKQVTFQIGCGAQMAGKCMLKVIYDFRTLDIALGGQGAPLVPVGDEMLFYEYDACVNLGGFANISYRDDSGNRLAFDICPVNIVLNKLIYEICGKEFDVNGEYGKKGMVNSELLNDLNSITFYDNSGPKSLAREWVEQVFEPIVNRYKSVSRIDVLTTCYHHFAYQIKELIKSIGVQKVLFTGGGTFNAYLMSLITESIGVEITIPDREIIDYKEALIFAFLGVLRAENQANCLASVTGAIKDNCGGLIFIP